MDIVITFEAKESAAPGVLAQSLGISRVHPDEVCRRWNRTRQRKPISAPAVDHNIRNPPPSSLRCTSLTRGVDRVDADLVTALRSNFSLPSHPVSLTGRAILHPVACEDTSGSAPPLARSKSCPSEQSSSPSLSLLSRSPLRSPSPPPQPSARPKMTIYRGRCTFSIGTMACVCANAEADAEELDSDLVCRRCGHKFIEHEDIPLSVTAIPPVTDTIKQGTSAATLPSKVVNAR
jgi:hypothetical protein